MYNMFLYILHKIFWKCKHACIHSDRKNGESQIYQSNTVLPVSQNHSAITYLVTVHPVRVKN